MDATYRTAALRSLALALLAGGFWAAWAWYVNHEIAGAGPRAAITQGVFSFLMTFVFATLVEWAYLLSPRRGLRYLLTVLIPTGLILLTLPLAHWLRGTPDILLTVTPPVLLAAGYCMVFTYVRDRKSK